MVEVHGFQLNCGYASKLHFDSNILGPSMIITLGNYTGGDLWIHVDDIGNECVQVTEKMK